MDIVFYQVTNSLGEVTQHRAVVYTDPTADNGLYPMQDVKDIHQMSSLLSLCNFIRQMYGKDNVYHCGVLGSLTTHKVGSINVPVIMCRAVDQLFQRLLWEAECEGDEGEEHY